MEIIQAKHIRLLAIDPSTRGFGFALFDEQNTLADWGTKSVGGNKNERCLAHIQEMIVHTQPQVIVLQNMSAKGSRRSPRIKALSKRIITLASKHKVNVALFSRAEIMKCFFPDGEGTKHALAAIIAQKFPDELGFRLPPERKAWMTEDGRMDLFDAMSLALVFKMKRAASRARSVSSNDSLVTD